MSVFLNFQQGAEGIEGRLRLLCTFGLSDGWEINGA